MTYSTNCASCSCVMSVVTIIQLHIIVGAETCYIIRSTWRVPVDVACTASEIPFAYNARNGAFSTASG